MQTIKTLAILFRDPIMTITTALESVTSKLSEEDYAKVKKYINMVNQSCYQALKQADTICEETACFLSEREDQIMNCDMVAMLHRIKTQAAESLKNKNVTLQLGEMPETHIVACRANQFEHVAFGMLSALLRDAGSACTIRVALRRAENQTFLSIERDGASWSNEYIQFIQKKRKEHLIEDVQKYGYNMLRIGNILRASGGKVLVETPEKGGVRVILVLPERKTPLRVEDRCEPWHSTRTALTELSDVLSSDQYSIREESPTL